LKSLLKWVSLRHCWKDCLISNMEKISNTSKAPLGFSLAEMLAALTIGAMVLVAVLGIYSRAETSVTAVTKKLDSSQLPSEVLQHIAEDVDRITAAGSNTQITVENKFERGFQTAKMIILKTIYATENRPQTFERIVWQGSYDRDANGLVLYRSYNGVGLEDKLLDEQRSIWEQEYPFVPICDGVTFFEIQVPSGENFSDRWMSNTLPRAVVVTISFAEPLETLTGMWDVPDAKKTRRTIAIDRTRKIRFIFVPKEYEDEENQIDEKGNSKKQS